MSALYDTVKQRQLESSILEAFLHWDLQELSFNDLFIQIDKHQNTFSRICYSNISECIISYIEDDPESEAVIIEKLEIYRSQLDDMSFLEKCKIDFTETSHTNVKRFCDKVTDHTKLEASRYRKSKKAENEFLDQAYKKTKDSLDSTIKEIDQRLTNISLNTVGILGIFSAIIVAFFGSLNILSAVMAQVTVLSIPKLIFLTSFCGLIIYNTTFLFLYSLSKIVEKPITSNRIEPGYAPLFKGFGMKIHNIVNGKEEIKVRPDKTFFIFELTTAFKHYPLTAYFNLLLFIMMILSVLLWGFDKYCYNII